MALKPGSPLAERLAALKKAAAAIECEGDEAMELEEVSHDSRGYFEDEF